MTQLCWYIEAVLGGSLFVVLALPEAVVVGKALTGSRELEGLVPTWSYSPSCFTFVHICKCVVT